MNGISYARCQECDEEGVFRDGSTCARCLGLGYLPIENADEEVKPAPQVCADTDLGTLRRAA
jgi:hypothetical protein